MKIAKPARNRIALGVAAALMVTSAPLAADEVELRKEIRHLKERVDTLEAGRTDGGPLLPEGLEFGGLVEIEAASAEDYAGDRSSDVVLATVELGAHAIVSDWVEAQLLFLYEEDDTPFGVDEGIITVGNPEVMPLYAAGGRMYVPFGNFTTGLVSDPLTLEVAETRESAFQIGFEQGGAYGSLYVFNGDTDDGGDDTIEHVGGNLGYAEGGLDLGVGYISSLGDSELLQEELGTTDLQDYVGGINAYGIYSSNGLTAVAEYVAATGSFESSELAFDGTGAEPAAFNLEAGYEVTVAGRPAEVAVAYQGTAEALGLGLPESRVLAGVSIGINHRAALSFEWAHDKDYGTGDGGTGEQADIFTVQLAAEF